MSLVTMLTVYDEETNMIYTEQKHRYEDSDELALRYPINGFYLSEIVRDKDEAIAKEKFLLDNPELNIGGEVESEDPF